MYVRKVDSQSVQREQGAVGECESRSGWLASAPSVPAQGPWTTGVHCLVHSTLLLLSVVNILSMSWFFPASGVLWSSFPVPDSGTVPPLRSPISFLT